MRSLCTRNAESRPATCPFVMRDVVGVGVTAEPVVGLEQLHVELPLQQVGGGQTGHPAAHDGDGRRAAVLVVIGRCSSSLP